MFLTNGTIEFDEVDIKEALVDFLNKREFLKYNIALGSIAVAFHASHVKLRFGVDRHEEPSVVDHMCKRCNNHLVEKSGDLCDECSAMRTISRSDFISP